MSTSGPFDNIVQGLVGPDGRALGGTTHETTYVGGAQWGVAFLMLRDGEGNEIVGVCHLDADDCMISETEMADDGALIQTLMLRVKPVNHQFAAPWEGIPGTALQVLEGRRAWEAMIAAQMAEQEAIENAHATLDGETPAEPDDGEATPE